MLKLLKLSPLFTAFLLLIPAPSMAETDPIATVRAVCDAGRSPVAEGWKYKSGDIPSAEAVEFDDSSWETGKPQFTWGHEQYGWVRARIVLPEKVHTLPLSGKVTLAVAVDDFGEIFVNGEFKQRFHWDNGMVTLTESAKPGEEFVVAVRILNTGGPGRMSWAKLGFEGVDSVQRFLDDYRLASAMTEFSAQAQGPELKEALNRCVAAIDNDASERGDTTAFMGSIERAAAELAPFRRVASESTCHLIGHGHIDMNWLWLWPETVEVCQNTFTSVTDLMAEYPDFTYSQSQPSTYKAVQDTRPELFDKMRKAIDEGRWEITGGTWVEHDTNMPSGEAIVRQMLYARKYFRETFGRETEICWMPDTFGHSWQMPQIMKKSGLNYYVFCRCAPGPNIFWWEGIEGTKVLAYNPPGWYSSTIHPGVADAALRQAERNKSSDIALVYGVGDHGGGPTRADIANKLQLDQRTVKPNFKFSTIRDFFGAVENNEDIPTVSKELNFTFQGCYTSHGDIKLMNRKSENLLPTAEAFSAIAGAYGGSYPLKGFTDSWEKTCFNQFHDIIDGCAINGSYDYSRELFEKLEEQGAGALNASLARIAGQVNTRGAGTPVVVFNPLSWARTDTVEIDSPLTGEAHVVDSVGRVLPAQRVGDKIIFTAKNVPSLGYSVFWIKNGPARGSAVQAVSIGDNYRLENEYLRVDVSKASGTIVSVYDKKAGREVIESGKNGSLLQALSEGPIGMSAWEIGEIRSTADLLEAKEVEILHQGPVSCSVRVDHAYNDSSFAQDITLYSGVPRIDIQLSADWQEIGNQEKGCTMMKTAFTVDVKDGKATFEIPFGSIERKADGSEVPAQKWIDYSNDEYGVSLLNNCKYGHDVNGNTMRLTLLRSSYDPDPRPDVGIHDIGYSLYPHSGDWREAGTVRKGYEVNNPLIPVTTTSHTGSLPARKSFMSVAPANLVVTALKQAEDGKGMILRFYESSGEPTEAKIRVDGGLKTWIETDLIERPQGDQPKDITNGEINMPVGKWEIKTILLK